MTSIQETVDQTLSTAGLSGYARQAQPVVDALTKREQDIANELIRFATDQGLSRADAIAACEEAGLTVYSGTPDAEGSGDMDQKIEDLRADVRSLVERLDNMTRTNQ